MIQRFLFSPWFLCCCAGLSFCLGLGWTPLFDLDEGAFTEATREMLSSGIYSATYLDGEPRYDKPIFFYWLQAASITLLGYNEWAFRLPSVIAACLWVLAVFQFVREQADRERAYAAAFFMCACLWVALIARSAIADALLNLFLSLTLFDIWRYFQSPPERQKRFVWRSYLWMGLGVLTKGPVAIVIPLAVSLAYLLSTRSLKKHYTVYFNPIGWLVFILVVTPWIVAVSLQQGWGFFQGFILEHNLARFSSTRENHGGSLAYYLIFLPIILLPLSGLLPPLLMRVRTLWQNELYRFLSLWFLAFFTVFSFSKTQLPHYILNGCVPLIILFAMLPKLDRGYRWAPIVAVLLASIFVFLPELLALGAEKSRGYDGAMLSRHAEVIPGDYRAWALALLLALSALSCVPGLRTWQRLGLCGVLINAFVFTHVVRVYSGLQQAPIHQTIAYLEQHWPDREVVAYRMHMPSFSVYRQRITPLRRPKAGELALVRVDRLQDLQKKVEPIKTRILFSSGALVLLELETTASEPAHENK